jgi:hypothetical protein
MLIGRQRHLTLTVRGPSPWPPDRDTPATEGDLAVLVTVTNSSPIMVVAALWTDDLLDLILHQFAENAEPDTDRQGEQPLLRCPNELPQRLLHTRRQDDFLRGRLRDRYVAVHGGSS